MPDLKYAVIFAAVDQLTDKLSSFGGGFLNLGDRAVEAGKKIGEAGEAVQRFGERLSLDAALLKEGTEKFREWSEAISEPVFAMQKSLATTAALTGLNAEELTQLKERAIDFSNTHPGITAEKYVDGFTRMREVFQDTGKAMAAENVAAELSRFGIEGEAATDLLTAGFTDLHVQAGKTGDQLIRTVQLFGLAPDRAQQLAMAIGRLGGVASQTHSSLSEVLALAGSASQQIPGGRGAMMFASMIREIVQASSEGKNAIDFSRGLAGGLSQLRAQIAGLPTSEKMEALKKMGVMDPAMMLGFLDNLDATLVKQRAIESSAGALGTAYKTGTANATDQIALLHQNIDSLYDSMAAPALPLFNAAIERATGLIQGGTAASERHSKVMGGFATGLFVAGNAAYYGVEAMSTLGAASIFVGQGMKVLSYSTNLVTAAQWAWNLAMEANPIVIGIAAVVALGVALYELYEHWSAVKGYLSSSFTSLGNWTIGWAKTVGQAVLMGIAGPFGMIGVEIYKHWDSIKAACEKLGSGIISYFVHHSPPAVGPLHELGNIQIGETIAEHIRPAPVLAAIRRTAAAAALASTTIIAGGSGPALAGGAPGASGPSGGGAISFNFAPVINGSKLTKQELLDVLRESAREAAKILAAEATRKERSVLS